MPRLSGSWLAILTVALPAAAAAQQPGNAEAGRELASQLCSSCHIVGGERAGSDRAPPFPAIAKDPDLSLAELHGWGGQGHPVLRHLALTPEQMADINAYLDSLRGPPPAEAPPPETGRGLPQAPPERIGPPIGKPSDQDSGRSDP